MRSMPAQREGDASSGEPIQGTDYSGAFSVFLQEGSAGGGALLPPASGARRGETARTTTTTTKTTTTVTTVTTVTTHPPVTTVTTQPAGVDQADEIADMEPSSGDAHLAAQPRLPVTEVGPVAVEDHLMSQTGSSALEASVAVEASPSIATPPAPLPTPSPSPLPTPTLGAEELVPVPGAATMSYPSPTRSLSACCPSTFNPSSQSPSPTPCRRHIPNRLRFRRPQPTIERLNTVRRKRVSRRVSGQAFVLKYLWSHNIDYLHTFTLIFAIFQTLAALTASHAFTIHLSYTRHARGLSSRGWARSCHAAWQPARATNHAPPAPRPTSKHDRIPIHETQEQADRRDPCPIALLTLPWGARARVASRHARAQAPGRPHACSTPLHVHARPGRRIRPVWHGFTCRRRLRRYPRGRPSRRPLQQHQHPSRSAGAEPAGASADSAPIGTRAATVGIATAICTVAPRRAHRGADPCPPCHPHAATAATRVPMAPPMAPQSGRPCRHPSDRPCRHPSGHPWSRPCRRPSGHPCRRRWAATAHRGSTGAAHPAASSTAAIAAAHGAAAPGAAAHGCLQ